MTPISLSLTPYPSLLYTEVLLLRLNGLLLGHDMGRRAGHECHMLIICWDVMEQSNRELVMYLQPVPCRGAQPVKCLPHASELLSGNGTGLKAEVKSRALC